MSIPQADLARFVAKYSKPYDPATDTYRRPAFASPIKAGKATAVYNAHSYHTKVPPQGIEPYIRHYTEPGDLVLDPFCGSGMTGVAALKLGRRAILNDLSPAAAHIAYNFCTPFDVEALNQEFERIKLGVKGEFDWLYGTTCDNCGGSATIHFTVWSDVLECERCAKEMVLWEIAVDRDSGKVHESFSCPNCKKEQVKRGLRWLRSVPVLTNYECHRCKPARREHSTTEEERNHIAEIEAKQIPYWFPTNPFQERDWEMWRGVHRDQGIDRVDMFFTRRNLRALSRLWQEIGKADPRAISKLQFAFTGITTRLVSKLTGYQFGKRGNVPVSGTLYVASFTVERNVWGAMADRVQEIAKIANEFPKGDACIRIGSATSLPEAESNTVDYIFTDPPFGSNIFYADCNFIWESWLGEFTDQAKEAVVHVKHKDKNTLPDYARLMTSAFREMYRVLKPGRWASVVFHNSDDKIWQTILDGAETAGFELADINSFDKEQLSFKGIRGAKGLERVTNKDIVLNLRKPIPDSTRPSNGRSAARNGDAEVRVVRSIADFLSTGPSADERTLQHFWNVVLREMLANGVVEVSMEQVGDMLPFYFKQVDGRWYLRGEAVMGGNAYDLKTDLGAIAWLSAVLNKPQTIGELIPQWQADTAQKTEPEPGRLERLLQQNFWLEKKTGRWRHPTPEEREKMTATQDLAAEAHLRVIRRFLSGQSMDQPSNRELAEWVRFAYRREAYGDAIALYSQVDRSNLQPEYLKELDKVVSVCRMYAGKAKERTE